MSNKHRPAPAGVAASPSPGAATPDPIIELAAELFARHWVPKGSYVNDHLANQCLSAAADFYDAAASPKQSSEAA